MINNTMVFLKISLLELKVQGIATTLLVLIIPLGIMGLVYFIGGLSSPDYGMQMLCGNLTLVISQSCIVFLASSLLYLKLRGGFEQYSVFPINRSSLIVATVLFRMILLIPYLIVLFGISVYAFKVKINFHPLFFLIIFLAAVSLSSLGMVFALSSKNFRKSESQINIIMFLIMFGAPLFYPMKALPIPLQIIHFCLPFTYIVDGLKEVLAFTGYSERLWLSIAAMFFFSVLSITASTFFYKWEAVE
jgi:ABC-2 type transport system permease protein